MLGSFILGLLILVCSYGISFMAFTASLWPWFSPMSPGFFLFLFYLVAIVDNYDFPAFPLILVYLIGMHNYGPYSIVEYTTSHPIKVAACSVGYLGAGFLWTIPRIKLYLRSESIMKELKQSHDFVKANKNDTEKNLNMEAERFLSNNKLRIYSWILYWPFSIINVFTYDFIKELVGFVYGKYFKKIYLYFIRNAIQNLN